LFDAALRPAIEEEPSMNQNRLVLALLAAGMTALSTLASAAADPAMIAARQRIFGAENVDATTGAVKKDKVIYSWATNITYAVSFLGRVVLLDSYLHRAETNRNGRTPVVVEDLVDLHPEAIFLGHGHGDHADNAAFIAGTLNIPIYSSPETCDAMQNDAARYVGHAVTCLPVVTRGSVPGAEVVRLTQLEPLACIVAFKHIHSGTVPYDPTYPQVVINDTPDAREAQLYPPGTPHAFPTLSAGTGGSISLFYTFILRGGYNFATSWHNTTGPLKEGVGADPGLPSAAVGQHLFDVMDSLPRTDVEIGSIVSLGFRNNGERDAVMYNQHLRSKVYFPAHVTNATNPSSAPEWRLGWYAQNDAMGIPESLRPEPRWQVDPLDYLQPQVYSPGDPRWFDPGKSAAMQRYCGS